MTGEAHSKAVLAYGIVLPAAEFEAACKKKTTFRRQDGYDDWSEWKEAVEDVVVASGDLVLLAFCSLNAAACCEDFKYVLAHKDTKDIDVDGGDTYVGIASFGKIPADVSIDQTHLDNFFKDFGMPKPKNCVPKWMLINECQMYE